MTAEIISAFFIIGGTLGLISILATELHTTRRDYREQKEKYWHTKDTLNNVQQERDEALAREAGLAHIQANTVHVTGHVIGTVPPGLNDYDQRHRIGTWEIAAKRKLGLELSDSAFIQTEIDELGGQVSVTAHAYVQRFPLGDPTDATTAEVQATDG